VIVKLARVEDFEQMRTDVDADPRLTNEVKRERIFYSDQSRALSTFITVLGLTLTRCSRSAPCRRDDHHVRLGVEPGRRNRHAARARLSSQRGARAFMVEALLLGLAGGSAAWASPR